MPRSIAIVEDEPLIRANYVEALTRAGYEVRGYAGRVGLHELLVISRELRRLIQTNARAEQLQQAGMAEGMRTLRQDGILKVLAGLTSIEEVRAISNN